MFIRTNRQLISHCDFNKYLFFCMFVFQFISMSTILLSIGSNTFAKTNIDKAKRMLSYLFPGIIFSEPILSEPEDDSFKYLFRNILASFETDLSQEEIIEKIKQTERAVGRTPKDKYQGKVVIDIDLLKYGEEILRPQDFEKEYIQQLLAIFVIPEPTNQTTSPDELDSLEESDI
ncbi:MAG: hypothetical protein EWM46_05780 [Fermentimonas caenicola]|jgi:2-amino-4-hydroxy-6-hydroxymethyldihydropteridine diphosphokinase|nr:MAG: hypothetical protein EWM46_05780 [Fermentimonas caenicola]